MYRETYLRSERQDAQTLQKNASLLLTTGSDFYRYLKYVNGVVPHATAKEGKP